MTRTEMLAVLLLALATYCTRAAGLWLIGLIEMTPKRQRLLRDLSGSVLASILALAMISGDVGTWVGTLAAILVMKATNRTAAALIAAALGAAVIRSAWLPF